MVRSIKSVAFARGAMSWMAALGLVVSALSGSGCTKVVKPYAIDPDFSVNVAPVRPGWPTALEKSEMGAVHIAVLESKGAPSMMHLQWWPNETVTTKSRMYRKTRGEYDLSKANPKMSWLYPDKNEWVIFKENDYEVKEIPDKIRLICEVGDPNDMMTFKGSMGSRMEKWKYFRVGRIYTFADDRLIETDDHSLPPMPNYLLE